MRTTKAQISLRIRAVDQRLCCSLLRKYKISRVYIRNFKTLANFCGCAGRFESDLVTNPEDRFSRVILSSNPNTKMLNMSLVTRKPVFGVCDQGRLKPACAATEASWRLRVCAGWSAPLLFAYGINRFSHDVAHMSQGADRTGTTFCNWNWQSF